MNLLDYLVLAGTLLGIAAFGMWRTRGHHNLRTYLKGSAQTHWFTIGLSVMATQASAITFLSTPGQGYESGLGFVQNYFGAPLALIVIAVVFLPIYRKLNVYTAYEYLGRRFDSKTRLLGAGLFLLQRGLGAGITIYAPAIVLSTMMGWRLDVTIIATGLIAVIYTMTGGSDAVNLTQKYQIGVIFIGMIAAFFVLLGKLPVSLGEALTIAGDFNKLEAVDYSFDPDRRYTVWTGMLGGMFLALSYFGTDQSQVQRYLSGASLRESRLGLMFNGIFKIPMQFFILLLGVLVFVFYRFERPPVFFNQPAWQQAAAGERGQDLRRLEAEFAAAHAREKTDLERWVAARRAGDASALDSAAAATRESRREVDRIRAEGKAALNQLTGASAKDSDYVFITFVLQQLPHGLIGLLVTVFFAAALSSKAGELNALGSTTTVDLYRHTLRREATDDHYVKASKWFTFAWGLIAIGFALYANLAENLIEAVNIIGSIFYGVVLGLFLVAFFLKRVGGTAVFWAAVVSQALVLILYFNLSISYLWYNVIGCVACAVLAVILQTALDLRGRGAPSEF